MLLENVQKLMKIHTTNQAFNTTTYEVLEWMSKKKEERDQKSKLLFQKTDWQIYDDKALWFVNNMKSRNQQVVFKHLPGNFYNFKYVLKINKV